MASADRDPTRTSSPRRPRRRSGSASGSTGSTSSFTLGSGWSAASDDLGEEIGSCPLGDLPGFSAPVVVGHGGLLRVVRTASGKTAAVLTGRTHYYEGRGVAPVVHGVRTMVAAGRDHRRADQRLRRARRRPPGRHRRPDARPHQPHRGEPAGRAAVHRHDRGLLEAAARPRPRPSTPTCPRASTRSSTARPSRPRPRC